MRGDYHGGVGRVICHYRVYYEVARCRVHAAYRLVQQIELGPAGHGEHQLYLFLRTLAHLLEPGLGTDVQAGQQLSGALLVEVGVEVRVEIQKLLCVHPHRQGHAVGQIADQLLCLDAGRPAADFNLAAAGLQEPAGYLYERGLAGAVRTQQAEYTSAPNLQADAVERLRAAVALPQLTALKVGHFRSPPLLASP